LNDTSIQKNPADIATQTTLYNLWPRFQLLFKNFAYAGGSAVTDIDWSGATLFLNSFASPPINMGATNPWIAFLGGTVVHFPAGGVVRLSCRIDFQNPLADGHQARLLAKISNDGGVTFNEHASSAATRIVGDLAINGINLDTSYYILPSASATMGWFKFTFISQDAQAPAVVTLKIDISAPF
jgi:hypothetical protein